MKVYSLILMENYFQDNEAKVSVFDSGFLLGDGVWEGIRLHKGRLIFINEHLDRLFSSAKFEYFA